MNTVSSPDARWIGPIASYEAEPIDDDTFSHPGGPAPILGGYRPLQNEEGQWTAHASDTPLRYEKGQWWVGAPSNRSTQRAVVLLREAEQRGIELSGDFTPAERIVASLKDQERTPRYGYWLSRQIQIVEAALLIGAERVASLVEQVLATPQWGGEEVGTTTPMEANVVAIARGMHQHMGGPAIRDHIGKYIAAALGAAESAKI